MHNKSKQTQSFYSIHNKKVLMPVHVRVDDTSKPSTVSQSLDLHHEQFSSDPFEVQSLKGNRNVRRRSYKYQVIHDSLLVLKN